MYKAVIKCTERGAVAWVLQTQAAGHSGRDSVAYTLALCPSWFSHPNIRYFSSWFSTVMGVTKLTHTWKELVWCGQDLQDWVRSPLCSLSQICFRTFLPAHVRRGSDALWSLAREGKRLMWGNQLSSLLPFFLDEQFVSKYSTSSETLSPTWVAFPERTAQSLSWWACKVHGFMLQLVQPWLST